VGEKRVLYRNTVCKPKKKLWVFFCFASDSLCMVGLWVAGGYALVKEGRRGSVRFPFTCEVSFGGGRRRVDCGWWGYMFGLPWFYI